MELIIESKKFGKHTVLYDDEVHALVSPYKWYIAHSSAKNTYYCVAVYTASKYKQKKIYMHRLIMSPSDTEYVDHINRNGIDNRRVNLRVCTQSQNSANRRLPTHNKTGYLGVSAKNVNGKYRVSIMVKRKSIHGGNYTTPEEAARAYNALAIQHFGEFAHLNAVPV